MGTKMLRFVFAVALLTLSACSQPADTPPPQTSPPAATVPQKPITFEGAWTVAGDGIDTPESAYVDVGGSGDVFVSLVGGMPNQKDGNGRIMRLGIDGTVKSPDWFIGLNAPKGLRSHKGTLWTADIDEIVGIDIATAKMSSKIKVDGAQFLNDVAVGADGTVYVTDMLASRIYALKNNKASVFAEGEDLEYPNGILVEGDHLVVGGWGKPEADFSTKVPGRLYKLDLKSKKKTPITPEPTANIDGVESDGKGGYIVSDWFAGKIYRIGSDGKLETLAEFPQGTADVGLEVLPTRSLLIIPHMNEGKIVAYDLASLKK